MSADNIDYDSLRQIFGPSRVPTEENLEAVYLSAIGRIPPRVKTRLSVTGALDPDLLVMQEHLRSHVLTPECFNEKQVQLFVVAIMLAQLNEAAVMHVRAARKAGASWEELQAVIGLCYLFRGVPAANRGAEMLATVALEESALSKS
ncbi:MAG: carboxymuconolactone decarboxylase family protein [Desulfovibrio sp.]|jgi:AhpD family alkylhydroperoxidase|nr:carboxymuconolactone decarboxylase family protein [Desulfovibrio sp.]